MSKIKVVNIISDSNIGGAGKCIVTFFKTYDRSKFDALVIIPVGSKLKNELQAIGARVIEADGIADKSFSIEAVKNLTDILRMEKPDVIHTHGAMSGRVAARLGGNASVVYTRHCVYEPSKLMKSPLGRCMGWAINGMFSDYAIAVADAARDNLTDAGVPARKIKVVVNGIEPLKEKSLDEKVEIRHRLGIAGGCKVVSIVARLEDVKGHTYFIDAAQEILNDGANAVFVIAGTGKAERELRDKVKKLCLDDKIIFTGFMSDVSGLFNISHISVNASFGTEATSLSLLEGMSLGIPAVVTDYGGNPGVIWDGENGIIVPIKDSKAMAKAIKALLEDNELYNKMSANSRRIFNQRFTSQAMTREIENVYIKLAKGLVEN